MRAVAVDLKNVLNDIRFDERCYSESVQEWTYYFIAPAKVILEAFPGKFGPQKVVATEISIDILCEKKNECEFGKLDGVRILISPTAEGEDGLLDYEWEEAEISDSDISILLEKAMRQVFSFEEYWNSGLIIKDLCPPRDCPLCDKISKCIAETTFQTLNLMSEGDDGAEEIIRHAEQLYNSTCNVEIAKEEKLFEVHISEVLEKTVTVYANSEDEAYEKAEEMCNRGSIDLNGTDFTSRTVEVVGKSSTRINNEELNSDIKIVLFIPEEELKNMELYRSEDSLLSVDELQAICDSVESTQNDVVFAAATCGSTKFEICTTSNRHNLYLIESKLLPDFNYETVEVTNISSEIERLRSHWSLIDRLVVLNYWD